MKHINLFSRLVFIAIAITAVHSNVWGNKVTISGSGLNSVSSNTFVGNLNHGHIYITPPSGQTISFNDGGLFGTDRLVIGKWEKGDKTYTVSWDANTGSSISVSKITIKMGTYGGSLNGRAASATLGSNGPETNIRYLTPVSCKDVNSGTLTDAEKDNQSMNLDVSRVKFSDAADVLVESITVEYTITPNAPVCSPTTASLDVTLDASNPTVIDLANYFSVSEDHYKTYLGYGISSNPKEAGHISSSNFYATAAGTYYIYSYIQAGKDCHEQSANSTTLTITVNRRTPTLELTSTSTTIDKTLDTSDPNSIDIASMVNMTTYRGDGLEYAIVSGTGGTLQGSRFYSTTGGTYTIRITSKQQDQYTETSKDVTVVVNEKAHASFTKNYTSGTIKVGETIANAYILRYAANPNVKVTTNTISSICQGSEVISYNAATNTITALNAGTATITFTQSEDADHYGVITSYNITVNKHDRAGFSWNVPDAYFYNTTYGNFVARGNNDEPLYSTSTNPNVATATASSNVLSLTTYNVAGTTTITVSQPETYYYYAKSENITITPQKLNNHVELNITESNYRANGILVQSEGDLSWNDGGIRLGNLTGGFNWEDKSVSYLFTGLPDSLYFQYKKTTGGATGVDFFVRESDDGTNWSNTIWKVTDEATTNFQSVSIPLKTTTRYVKLVYSGNFGGVFKNIKIGELQRFTATPDSIGFGEFLYSPTDTYDRTFVFKHANAGYNVTASSNDPHFTVAPDIAQGQTGGDKLGEASVTVTYHPTDIGQHAGIITLTDQLGHLTHVKVTGMGRDKLRNTIVTQMNGTTTYSYLARFNENITLGMSSDNTDYEHYPISVEQIKGDNIATYDASTHTITTKAENDTAVFRLIQPTSNTYLADTAYISVVVESESQNCYVLYDMNRYSLYGFIGATYTRSWEGNNVAGTLTLGASYQTGGIDQGLRILQCINGNWVKIGNIEDHHSYTWITKEYTLDPSATGIRIESYGSLNNYIQNISVTRNTYLTVPESLTCPEQRQGQPATQASFTVDYSSCTNGDIHIVSDNSKFTVSPATISVADGTSGSAMITVTYNSEEAGDFKGIVRVSNSSEAKDIVVSARTYEKQLPIATKGEGGRSMFITRDTLNPAFHDIAYLMREQFRTNNYEHPDTIIELIEWPAEVSPADYKYNPATTHFYSKELGTYAFRVTHTETEHFTAISDTFHILVKRFTPIIYWYLNGEEYIEGTYLIGDGHPAISQGDTLKVACVSDIQSFTMDKTQYANITLVQDASKRTNGIADIQSPTEAEGDVVVTLTAHSTQTKYYEAVSASKTFIVTRKLRQTIVWDDDLSALMTEYERKQDGSYTDKKIAQEIILSGYTIDDAGNPTDLPVTYEITPIDPATVQPSDWSLTVDSTTRLTTFHYTTQGAGFLITATQDNKDAYAPAAPMTKRLNVYDYHDGCTKEVTILNPTETNGKEIEQNKFRLYDLSFPSSVTLHIRKQHDGAWLYNEARPVIIDFYDGPTDHISDHEGHCTGNLILSKTIAPNDIPVSTVAAKDFTIDGIPETARSMYIHTISDHGFNLYGVSYIQQQYAHPAVDEITILAFSSQPSDPEKFSVNWMNDVINVECTNKRCTVSPTSFGECGGQGIARMSVVFNAPALPTTETGEIIFRDLTGNVLAIVPLTAQVNYGIAQHVTSFNVKPSYYTIDSTILKATTDRPELTEFTYTVSGDPDVAYVEINKQGEAVLKFYRSGVISVTAYQAGTPDIAPASYTIDNVVVDKTPLIDLIPPVAATIDYGSPMQAATLTNGSAGLPDRMNVPDSEAKCPGKYQWTNPSEIHDANYGNPQLLPVVYIPAHEQIDYITKTTVYYDERYAATSTKTNLLINRVQPELTWNDASPLEVSRGEDRDLHVQVRAGQGDNICYLEPKMEFRNGEQLARFSYSLQSDGTYTTTMTALRTGTAQLTATYPASQNYHSVKSITKTLTVQPSTQFAWTLNDSARFYANTTIPFSDLVLGAEGTNISIEADGIHKSDTARYKLENFVVIDNSEKTITFLSPTPYYLTLTAKADGYTDKVLHFIVIENEQFIRWNQDFFDNYYYGSSKFYYQDTVLNAIAVDAQGNPTNQSITYKIADGTIAEIHFNADSKPVLHFKRSGITTITATASGGGSSHYTPASTTTRICVYKEGYQCSEYLYTGPESFIGTIIGVGGVTHTWEQPNVADQLSFKGALTSNTTNNQWLLIYYRTTKGENGQSDVWTLTDSVYVIGSWRDFKLTIPNNVTGVRFANPRGVLVARAVTGIAITRHRYFYLTEDSIHVSHLGINVTLNREFETRYSANPLIKYGLKHGNDIVTTSPSGLTITPNRMIDNDCDYSGSYTFTLSGKWSTPQQIRDTAVIYDSAGKIYYVPIYINVENGKRFIFDRPEGGTWNQSTNWALSDGKTKDYFHGLVPGIADSVEIRSMVEVAQPTDVYSIAINANGQVHIGPQGGLSVHQGGISGATADNLLIQSTIAAQGYFRMDPTATDPVNPARPCAMPAASVQFATRGTLDTGNDRDATWQYTGVPSQQTGAVLPYSAEWYLWSEQKGWLKNSGTNDPIQPFLGYATAPYGNETFVWKGSLIQGDYTVNLTYTESDEGMWGANVFANSYSSPIDLKQFEESDFVNGDKMDKTFYIFNAGSWNQWQNGGDTTVGSISYVSGGNSTPGHYTAIPVLAAKDLDESIDMTMIASLEGVYVQTYAAGCQIHLDYERHVWEASSDFHQMNYPARAPQRTEEQENFNRVRLQVNSSTSGADYIYVLERPEYTAGYDNGYDAPKALPEPNRQTTVYLYTAESYGANEISATDNAEGMYIGFLSSEDVLYTLTARSVMGETFYLEDTETGTCTYLSDSAQYTFTARPNTTYEHRFRLLKHAPEIVTDIKTITQDDIKQMENQAADGVLKIYTVTGLQVADGKSVSDLQYLPVGVYLIQMNNETVKFVKK